MDKPATIGNIPNYLDQDDNARFSKAEIEVRLAIADYVIRRVAGTPNGLQIFEALVSKYEDKYPHHKLLSLYLISPENIDPENLD